MGKRRRLFPGSLLWILLLVPQILAGEQQPCIGVEIGYQVASVSKIFPFLPGNSSSLQPYKFQSTLSLRNTGFREVRNWQVFIGFQHREWLAHSEGLALADGRPFPAQIGESGATLVGFPQSDIKNSIETAGDESKIQISANLVGTEFGVSPPDFPLPGNLSLVSSDHSCGTLQKIQGNRLQVCCSENAWGVEEPAGASNPDNYPPREAGDITISYDVLQTYENFYWAQVTISNDNQFGRINNWKLEWEWTQGEFIHSMRGAQTLEQAQSECINGPAGEFYKNIDFSLAMNCQRNPAFIDLGPEKLNDTEQGRLQFCCRNGTLLPKIMDPSQAKSEFRLQVYKLPPNQAREKLVPPTGFNLGPRYRCGSPRLVSPSRFEGDPVKSSARSWQVTCNVTGINSSLKPSCCVSFSAFYNHSVVPCRTCACGCPGAANAPSCDANAQALLLPAEALLVPFSNRSEIAARFNELDGGDRARARVPCGDYCGVSINWHLASDHSGGWTARMSLFNWGEFDARDWFAVVEMDAANARFMRSYSFNATLVESETDDDGPKKYESVFVRGKPGLNYLIAAHQNVWVRDQQLAPGQLQSVLSFERRSSAAGSTPAQAFPARVFFDGEKCSLPTAIPESAGAADLKAPLVLVVLSFVLFF